MSRFIKALLKQPVDCTPIWIMRQAGRYLPEYRAIRQKAGDFLTLCKTPELACEVSLQPLRRYALDAAIIFSDILTIPDAMGLDLHFIEGEGPVFNKPISSIRDIEQLPFPDPATDLRYVCDAITLCRRELKETISLIGFAGSPWTLACYMIEGRSSKEFKKIKNMLYEAPLNLHVLLKKLACSTIDYLNAQIQAGAQVVMLFDTWGGLLSDIAYPEFSLNYMREILASLPPSIPSIVFTKGGGLWLDKIAQIGCSAVGLDWTVNLDRARKEVGTRVALQGNMDPAVLYSSCERIQKEVGVILKQYGYGSGHIFNLGHGITPEVKPENVNVLVEAVHDQSKIYHQ